MNNITSKGIDDFLTFLRETEQNIHIAEMIEQESNDATQDILHQLELCDVDYHQSARLAKKLREVRQERRSAKDRYDTYAPIVNWMDDNRNTIKALERLLGDVRKSEKLTQGRFYTPKTKVLENKK